MQLNQTYIFIQFSKLNKCLLLSELILVYSFYGVLTSDGLFNADICSK